MPIPAALKDREELLLQKLEEATEGPVPCKYLGVDVGGRYERDPSKWPSGDKSKTSVWYEWSHVLRGDKQQPHRVSTSVHDLVHHPRSVPHAPLDRCAPTNLYFTMEFMQAFAERKHPGTTYTGVSFESERPEFAC